MTQSPLAVPVPVEVLAPDLDLTEIIAKVMQIQEVLENSFIPTNRASNYFKWLDETIIVKYCGRVIGPRSVGKSKSSKQYRHDHQTRVSYIQALFNTNSGSLFTTILQDIKHAAWQGKKHILYHRLKGSLKNFGIKILVVDNAENLQKEAVIDLKQLHEESRVPIVLVGLPELDQNLDNWGLLNCFPRLFQFDELDEDDFTKTLDTIEFDVLSLPAASNLSEGRLFEHLTIKSKGSIGSAISILLTTVLHSLAHGHGKVDEGTLVKILNSHATKYTPR